MADVSKMALKILYTLDNGSSGTYLARSKKPQSVNVVTIPNPNSPGEGDQANYRIGAIELSPVLQEIYMNSPELLSHNVSKSGHDYNLYYKDICEVDEPLVSLGLFSHIRQRLRKQMGEEIVQVEENDYEEPYMVTGRICSNFAALLKRSYSSTCGNDQEEETSRETLEVKLRFIRVVTEKTSRRPSNATSRLPRTPLAVQAQQHVMSRPSSVTRPSKVIRPVKSGAVRRQVNQTPAPKAERTQSLPIWNPKQQMANNTAFPANSIAHKIYLADRKTDGAQQSTQQPLAYQVNALQQDNTIQKYKVDDSVSKRFDFMLNKKKEPQQEQQQGKGLAGPKKSTAAKARRFNTMAAIPVPTAEFKPKAVAKKPLRTESVSDENLTPITEENFVLQTLLAGGSIKKQPQRYSEDNKENQPQFSDDFDLDLLSFPDIGSKGNIEWFGDFSPFQSPSLAQNNLFDQSKKPSTTTPKDPNTCNTISIENVEEEDQDQQTQDEQGKLTSDIDRTSPIDTLSMPLMELNDRSSARMVSCQEQLRRLPLLGKGTETHGKQSPRKGAVQEDEEVTSIVLQLSSSCQDLRYPCDKDTASKNSNSSQASTPPMTRHFEYQDDEEDELSEKTKRQRTMPSSPTTMFNYQEDTSSASDTNELFSSFIQSRPAENNNADSTPATQYENQSSDHTK